jgi:hypothetical protein
MQTSGRSCGEKVKLREHVHQLLCGSFPGRCAARSGALLIRGPSCSTVVHWVPALRSSAARCTASGTRATRLLDSTAISYKT